MTFNNILRVILILLLSPFYRGTESPLSSKEIKPDNLKENQPWIFIGRTDAEAPVFWSPDMNSQLTGKVSDAGKDWKQKEKRASENPIAGWYHRCNGHELGQTLGDSEGQGGLAYCSTNRHNRATWKKTQVDNTRYGIHREFSTFVT